MSQQSQATRALPWYRSNFFYAAVGIPSAAIAALMSMQSMQQRAVNHGITCTLNLFQSMERIETGTKQSTDGKYQGFTKEQLIAGAEDRFQRCQEVLYVPPFGF